MRLGKICSLFSVVCLALGFLACTDTVSSTDASELDGADVIPGYKQGKTYSSPSSAGSSSAQAISSDAGSSATESSSSAEESSSSEEESSSSEVEVDFSESEIQVDGSGVAVITAEYLLDVGKNVRSTLNSKKEELDNNEEPEGFSESNKVEFAVDDFDFDANKYYCFTESEEWKSITKDKLLETKLPFLWDMDYYDCRDRFSLSFESECVSIYVMAN